MPQPSEKPRKPSRNARLKAARLCAVQSLYQMGLTGRDAQQILRDYRDHVQGDELEGDVYVAAESALLSRIVLGVVERKDDIAQMVQGVSAKPLQKSDPLLYSVLCCGIYELLCEGETDTALIIKEYLDITGAFYEGEETKLVNAILDKQAKNLRLS